MKLTDHFDLSEFQMSPTATAMKIDNTIPNEILPNIHRLAEFLEVVRSTLGGRTVRINSGYRCSALNRVVKGAANSSHMRGLAADIVVPGMAPIDVCKKLAALDFDKCICEGTWTHIAIPAAGATPRKITMTAHFTPDGVTYTEGIA